MLIFWYGMWPHIDFLFWLGVIGYEVLEEVFSGATLIHTGLGIRRADAKSITANPLTSYTWTPL